MLFSAHALGSHAEPHCPSRALHDRVAGIPGILAAQSTQAIPDNRGFATVAAILDRSCSSCHDWTGSYDSITGNGHIVAGDLEKSILYQRIARDEMPASGDKLTPEEKHTSEAGFLRVLRTPTCHRGCRQPRKCFAGRGTAAIAPHRSFSSQQDGFHEVTGFTSTAMLFGAGVIGVVHFLDMMNQGHILRDAIGFTEGSPDALRIPWSSRPGHLMRRCAVARWVACWR